MTNTTNLDAARETSYNLLSSFLNDAQDDKDNSTSYKVLSSEINFHDPAGVDMVDMSTARFNNLGLSRWAFKQVAGMAKIPVPMLDRLYQNGNGGLITENLNALFPQGTEERQVLVRDGGNRFIRAVNGSAYSRLWDVDAFERADDVIGALGFMPSLPTRGNSYALNGNVFSNNGVLWRTNHESFGLFFDRNKENDPLAKTLGGFVPGVVIWNSEVGARSFGYKTFYMHMGTYSILPWAPASHKRKRFVHRGDISKGFGEYVTMLNDTAKNYSSRYTNDIDHFFVANETEFAKDEDAAKQRLTEGMKFSANDAEEIVRFATNGVLQSYFNRLSVMSIAMAVCQASTLSPDVGTALDRSLLAEKLIKKYV